MSTGHVSRFDQLEAWVFDFGLLAAWCSCQVVWLKGNDSELTFLATAHSV